MKISEYKQFKNIVLYANAEHDIWWCGDAWMDLTDKQLKDIKEVLNLKTYGGIIKIEKDNRGEWYMMPSGLKIKKEG